MPNPPSSRVETKTNSQQTAKSLNLGHSALCIPGKLLEDRALRHESSAAITSVRPKSLEDLAQQLETIRPISRVEDVAENTFHDRPSRSDLKSGVLARQGLIRLFFLNCQMYVQPHTFDD